MSIEDNKALVRRFFQGLGTRGTPKPSSIALRQAACPEAALPPAPFSNVQSGTGIRRSPTSRFGS